jgi:hypothetical protein
MTSLHTLRSRFVDAPDSLGARYRARRWARLIQTFPHLDQMSVIDLGGTLDSWLRAPTRPASLHLVNLETQPDQLPDWARADHADACDLPEHIRAGSYDLVISNSVIEHLGGHQRRLQFADNVHELADQHWIQTPYRYFPIEPHWVCPGFQFLPLAARATLAHHWPLSHTKPTTRNDAIHAALDIELLTRTEMKIYFPHSTIAVERAAGLTKSLIAIKNK